MATSTSAPCHSVPMVQKAKKAKEPQASADSTKAMKEWVDRFGNEPRKGCDILVQALEREGVDILFAYPGGCSMEIHQALTRSGTIQNILCRHEQGEIFAAEGFAKSTGRTGVCIATSGPGATNLVTGLADAMMDSVPLVAITGQVPRRFIGTDAFQETPIIEVTRQITKHNYLVMDVNDIARIVKEAFYLARTGRPGPVLIDLPKDVQQQLAVPDWDCPMSITGYISRLPPAAVPSQLDGVMAALKGAKKPVIYYGGGCQDARDELREFARKTGIPITSTLMGLGVFPTNDPQALAMLGMHGTFYANYAVDGADLLIALGVRFDDRVTGKIEAFATRSRIIHIAWFFAALDASQRPLIYAGGGIIAAEASQTLRAFVEAFGLPVTTTLMGLGALDTSDPLALHMLGMHGTAYANYAVEDCDFILTLGARFDDRVAGVPDKFAPGAKFIAQIDIDPAEFGKVKPIQWHHCGPMIRTLERLIQYGKAHGKRPSLEGWHAHIAELKQRHAMNYDHASELIQPYAVIEAINEHTQGRAIISTGVGQHQMWAAQYSSFREPRQWLTSGSMGTMGFGLPAAIGAQFARPDTLVIDIDGDASIRMNIGEMEVCTTYTRPSEANRAHTYLGNPDKEWHTTQDEADIYPNFVGMANAFGVKGARVIRKDDLEGAIEKMLATEGPYLLEVMVPHISHVLPMIPGGATFKDIIVKGDGADVY
ncbi:MAG: hypothetical protein WDW36_008923 [Sanguina aurantia]